MARNIEDLKKDLELVMLDTDDPDRREFAHRVLLDVREGEEQLKVIKAARKSPDARATAADLAAKLQRGLVPHFTAQEVRTVDINLAIRLLEDYVKVIDGLMELHRESGR